MNKKLLASVTAISILCLNMGQALATVNPNITNENKIQLEQKKDVSKDIISEEKKTNSNDKNEAMLKQIKDNKIDITNNELVAYVVKFIGTPYKYGGDGPSTFDCSGFVKYVYGQYDIKLPRTTTEQELLGTKVEKKDLKPGDLVFFGSPAYHVGIYVGNDCYIHASKPGDYVKIASLKYRTDYSKAIRLKEDIGAINNKKNDNSKQNDSNKQSNNVDKANEDKNVIGNKSK